MNGLHLVIIIAVIVVGSLLHDHVLYRRALKNSRLRKWRHFRGIK